MILDKSTQTSPRKLLEPVEVCIRELIQMGLLLTSAIRGLTSSLSLLEAPRDPYFAAGPFLARGAAVLEVLIGLSQGTGLGLGAVSSS